MSSLARCLKKLNLSEHEAAILRGKVDELKGDGYEAHAAATQAVEDLLDELRAQRQDVIRQAVAGAPKPPEAPVVAAPTKPKGPPPLGQRSVIPKVNPEDVPDPVNGKEPPKTVEAPQQRLLCISCSDEKVDTAGGTQPAWKVYNGPLWQTLRKALKDVPQARWPTILVLSGKYGVIGADTSIATYNERISKEKVDELIRRGPAEPPAPKKRGTIGPPNVIGQLRLRVSSKPGEGEQVHDVFLVGGPLYMKAFHALTFQLQGAGYVADDAAINQAKGRGIGDWRQQLGAWLKNAVGEEAIAEPEKRERTPKQKARDEQLRRMAQGRKEVRPERDSLLTAVVKLGGLRTRYREDVTGEKAGPNPQVPFVGYLFTDRKGAKGVDEMATELSQYHYLTPQELEDVDGGVQAVMDKLRDEIFGHPHYSMQYDHGAAMEAAQEDAAALANDDADLSASAEELLGDLPEEITPEDAVAAVDVVATGRAAGLTDEQIEQAVERASIRAENGESYGEAIQSEFAAAAHREGGEVVAAPAVPLTLTGETEAEIREREKAGKPRELIEHEQKVKADNERDFFALQPPQGRVEGERAPEQADIERPPESPTSLGPAEKSGRTAAEVEAWIAPIRRQWRNGPRIKVVQAHANVLFKVPSERARGIYHEGSVYLFADRIRTSEDAQFVLLHEVMGHAGLRGLFGEQLKPLLLRLYDQNATVRQLADERIAEAKRLGLTYRRELGVEEALADLAGAGKGKDLSGWRIFVAAIKSALRKLGFTLELSDNDVEALLARARRFIERGEREARPLRLAPASSEPAPVFYSALARAIAASKQAAAPAAQWAGILDRMPGIKREEIEASGVKEWLATQPGKITRDQVLAFVRDNGVRVDEVLLGGENAVSPELREWLGARPPPTDAEGWLQYSQSLERIAQQWQRNGDDHQAQRFFNLSEQANQQVEYLETDLGGEVQATHFSHYQLPGGQNYRELLLTLPAARSVEQHRVVPPENPNGTVAQREWRIVDSNGRWIESRHTPEAAQARAEELSSKPQLAENTFRSSHFDEPNVLAHIRFNDRTDADGKRVLFIEEIQSDWGQKGRKRGFDTDAERRARFERWATDNGHLASRKDEIRQMWLDDHYGNPSDSYWGQFLKETGSMGGELVPPAPFVTKTEAWVALALKRMIRYAAENGYDRVAWTTGEQQADRYDLSKQVERIGWGPRSGEQVGQVVMVTLADDRGSFKFTTNEKGVVDDAYGAAAVRSELLGKPLAEVVGKEVAEKIAATHVGTLEGEGLRIGGGGMRAFYDRIVPNVANDILKKMGGGEVGEVTFTSGIPGTIDRTGAFPHIVAPKQPGFDITPALRETVMQGMPLMSLDTSSPDRAAATVQHPTFESARNLLYDVTHSDRKLNRIISKFNTPYHLAQVFPQFRPLYDEAQAFQHDLSRFVRVSADMAKEFLVTIDKVSDALRFHRLPTEQDRKSVMTALMEGTLWGGGDPLLGKRWTREELLSGRTEVERRGAKLSTFVFRPLNEEQADMYQHVRDSVDNSLTENGKSLVYKLLRNSGVRMNRDDSFDVALASAKEQLDTLIADEKLRAEQQIEQIAERLVGEKDEDKIADLLAEKDQIEKLSAAKIDNWNNLKASIEDVYKKTQALIEHGYFPATRFGRYAVNVARMTMENGKPTWEELEFHRFDTQIAANLAKRNLAAKYKGQKDVAITSGVMNDAAWKLFRGLNIDALRVFAKYLVDDNGVPRDKDPLMQEFFRVAVAERSALKRLIHREGTPGWSTDIERVLAQYTVSSATDSARNYHGGAMLELADGIRDENGKSDDLGAYATRYVVDLQDPDEERVPGIRSFLANYFILGSLAMGAINLTQPVLISAPWLKQHTSWRHAMSALTRAAKDVVAGRDFTSAEWQAVLRARQEGHIEPQEIHQIRADTRYSMLGDLSAWNKLAQIAEVRGVRIPAPKLAVRKAMFLWGSIYSLTEKFNRQTTFLAAYRIAVEKGMRDPYAFAVDAVQSTQFTYNAANRPEWSRKGIGAVVMTFKTFTISYLELAKRLYASDKKAFAVLLATLIIASGTAGLPFTDDIGDLIDTIGQWMGYNTNVRKRMRKFIVDNLGDAFGEMLMHGVSGIPGMPIDVAQRMGFGNVFPGSALFKTSEPDQTRAILDVVGPAGAVFRNATGAVEGMMTGRPNWWRGLLPTGLQAAAQGGEMFRTGQYRDWLGRRVVDVDNIDSTFKLMGFQPNVVAKESRIIQQNQQDVALQRVIESGIVAKWAQGMTEQDPDLVKDAQAMLQDWNEKNPETPIRITPQQIVARARNLQMTREQRFVRAAPPEARGRVLQDLAR